MNRKITLLAISALAFLLLLVPAIAWAQDREPCTCPEGNIRRTAEGYIYNDGSGLIDWEAVCWEATEGYEITGICAEAGREWVCDWLRVSKSCWGTSVPRVVQSITLYTEPLNENSGHVPEPASLVLLATGLAGFLGYIKRGVR